MPQTIPFLPERSYTNSVSYEVNAEDLIHPVFALGNALLESQVNVEDLDVDDFDVLQTALNDSSKKL